MDGGCKAYQTLADECAINFIEKYAKQNVEAAFGMLNKDGWPLTVVSVIVHKKTTSKKIFHRTKKV